MEFYEKRSVVKSKKDSAKIQVFLWAIRKRHFKSMQYEKSLIKLS